jgi:hypothetical protein
MEVTQEHVQWWALVLAVLKLLVLLPELIMLLVLIKYCPRGIKIETTLFSEAHIPM